MQKTFLVFKKELFNTIFRRSFILILFILPLIGFLVFLFMENASKGGGATQVISQLASDKQTIATGIVDEGNLVKALPDTNFNVILFSSAEAARIALEKGEINAYYLIPKNYIDEGKITAYYMNYNVFQAEDDNRMIENIVFNSILNNFPEMEKFINPPYFQTEVLSPEPQRDPGSMLTFFVPYIVMILFYVIILSTSTLMLNSVTNEKTNRVIEILLTSITPMQILGGKIIALMLAGLIQTAVWIGSVLVLLKLSGKAFSIPPEFQLPPSFLLWSVVFFLGGYMLYASLMASVGALVSNVKEASQVTMIIILPQIIPMMFLGPIIQDPNSALTVALSLIPFTSPVTMMTRLAAGPVPLWQLLLAVALLAVTVYWLIKVSASLFKAQYLLSGSDLKIGYFLKLVSGKQP